MASYSFTPQSQGTSYFGGGFGSDLAGFGHSMYAGMSNGMNFANSLYDLQRKVALMPYEQNAQIANYNANQKQDELSAEVSGSKLWAENATRGITNGQTINRGLGYDSNTKAAAGIAGAATNPAPVVASGQTVGAVANLPKAVVPVTAPVQPTFAQAVYGAAPVQAQQGTYFQQPVQNMTPIPPEWYAQTAPNVASPQAYIDYTQDPTTQNQWVNGAYANGGY